MMRYAAVQQYDPDDLSTDDEDIYWIDCADLGGAVVMARTMCVTTGRSWVVVDTEEQPAEGVAHKGVWDIVIGEKWRGAEMWGALMREFTPLRAGFGSDPATMDMIVEYQPGKLAEAMSQPRKGWYDDSVDAMRLAAWVATVVRKDQPLINITAV
jgi:hypothetical protein